MTPGCLALDHVRVSSLPPWFVEVLRAVQLTALLHKAADIENSDRLFQFLLTNYPASPSSPHEGALSLAAGPVFHGTVGTSRHEQPTTGTPSLPSSVRGLLLDRMPPRRVQTLNDDDQCNALATGDSRRTLRIRLSLPNPPTQDGVAASYLHDTNEDIPSRRRSMG